MSIPSASDRVVAALDASGVEISPFGRTSSVPNLVPRPALLPALGPGISGLIETAGRPVVLFVDDDADVLRGLRLALRKQPLEMVTATSSREALSILESMRVDVLVSDDCMPGMSGSELMTLVRQSFPNTVRIMLTGHATLDATSRAVNDGGAFGFLTKPCEPRALCAMIEAGLSLRDHSRDSERR